jgi:hypothetical protein
MPFARALVGFAFEIAAFSLAWAGIHYLLRGSVGSEDAVFFAAMVTVVLATNRLPAMRRWRQRVLASPSSQQIVEKCSAIGASAGHVLRRAQRG